MLPSCLPPSFTPSPLPLFSFPSSLCAFLPSLHILVVSFPPSITCVDPFPQAFPSFVQFPPSPFTPCLVSSPSLTSLSPSCPFLLPTFLHFNSSFLPSLFHVCVPYPLPPSLPILQPSLSTFSPLFSPPSLPPSFLHSFLLSFMHIKLV